VERILKKEDSNIHKDKNETVGKKAAGAYDYYRDKETGEIYLVPDEGQGDAIPTGLGK
jgi:hypothetical protein